MSNVTRAAGSAVKPRAEANIWRCCGGCNCCCPAPIAGWQTESFGAAGAAAWYILKTPTLATGQHIQIRHRRVRPGQCLTKVESLYPHYSKLKGKEVMRLGRSEEGASAPATGETERSSASAKNSERQRLLLALELMQARRGKA